jgi:DNA-binding MarR family transcriptional regulator
MAGDAKNLSLYDLLDRYQFKFYKYYHVLFKVGLKPNEVHILSIILSFNKAGQIYNGSYGFLCKELNITSKTALNALNSLIDKGFIKKQASKGGNVSIYSVNEKILKDIFLNYENFSQLTDNKPLQNVTVKHKKTSQKQWKNSTVNSGEIPRNKNIYKNNNKNIYAHSENEQVYSHEDDIQKEDDNHSSNIIKQDTKNKAIKKQNKELNELQEKQFDKFWQAYPKKVSKKQAQKSWKKINPSLELFEKILKALEMVKQTEQWKKDNGKYVPYPATWLNQERWTDEINMMQDTIKEEQKTKPVYYPVCENMLENDF